MPSFSEILSQFSAAAGMPAAYGVVITSGLLLVAKDWRLAIGAVAAQYVFAVALFGQTLPPQVAGVKMMVGLLCTLILFLSANEAQAAARRRREARKAAIEANPESVPIPEAGTGSGTPQADTGPISLLQVRGTGLPTGLPFRLTAAVIIGVSAVAISSRPENLLPEVSSAVTLAVFALGAMSVMVVALTEAPLEISLGLLTLLTGFELFYHAVEPSLSVIGLLAMAHFGIAMVGGYLTIIGVGKAEVSRKQL